MKTIWTFGSSFTFGDGCRSDKGIFDGDDSYYKEYYSEGFDIWPNILGNLSELPVINLAKSGATNDMIIDSIIDSFDAIYENDIVIIQKTFFERFDVPFPFETEFKTQHKQFIDGSNIHSLLKKNMNTDYKLKLETLLNFALFFSGNNLYRERHEKRFNFLKNQLLKKTNKVYFWDVSDDFVKSIHTISQHSNNKFKDLHFSFIGHRQFAEMLYDLIFLDKKKII